MNGRVVPLRMPAGAEPPWSDDAVAHACAAGDPAAIAEMFNRHHGAVTRFLSRLVGPGPDVEDLLQATFMEVARVQTRFEGRSSVTTWLLGIAANVARHHMRSQRRWHRLRSVVAVVTPRAGRVDADDTLQARRDLRAAQHKMDGLSEDHRIAFALCELEGVSAREAARILGTTESAIWKRVSDVRKALREVVAGRRP